MIPEEVSKEAVKATVNKIYDDMLSGSAKEVGNFLTNIAKTAHLFLLPLQATATIKDRLSRYLSEVSNRVPVDKQVLASESYAGEIINRLAYLSETDYLKDYYLNLLENSINQDKIHLAHPSFPTIIHQLSKDEILLLERLKEGDIIIGFEYDILESEIVNEKVIDSNFNLNTLSFPGFRKMYVEHLQHQYLLQIKSVEKESYNIKTNLFHRKMKYGLSEFGKLFLAACSR